MTSHSSPPNPCRAVARAYRDRWGWPVFASSDAVWLRLPVDMAAISVLPSAGVRSGPALGGPRGPALGYPDGRVVLLARCDALDCPHGVNELISDTVAHLGWHACVDLPPTTAPGGGAGWLREPAVLPECADVLGALGPLVAMRSRPRPG